MPVTPAERQQTRSIDTTSLARLLLLAIVCLYVAPAWASVVKLDADALTRVSNRHPTSERPYPSTEKRAACKDFNPTRSVFFGDLHVHTALSQDASTQGTRNLPDDAYRFARGERMGIQPYKTDGEPVRTIQLERPLDFAAVTDHAEMLGEVNICQTPGLPGHDSFVCMLYRNFPRAAFFLMNAFADSFENPERFDFCGPGETNCLQAAEEPWAIIRDAAEAGYDRTAECAFTTFVGYEWTATPLSNNLHRNVIFRNAKVPRLPASYYDAPSPEHLWQALASECTELRNDCDALIIPHNSNLSGARMFLTETVDGAPIDAEYAAQRAAFEPLVEVIQHKGASECLPDLPITDELCAFESLPYGNFAGQFVPIVGAALDPKSYARDALLEGLSQQGKLGVNPFRFGLVGSTDTHLGAAGLVDEESFVGQGGAGVPAKDAVPPGLPDHLEFNPGGLAALWAEENTRDALFEAMRRREAYATSGPRISVRLFAGRQYPPGLCASDSFVDTGYALGVPMGGELAEVATTEPDKAPTIAVWAQRDPGTAERPGRRLERVQIVKGWLQGGTPQQRVFDVKGTPVDSPDPSTCGEVEGGADQLCTVWSDPDFDADEPAFYYARVLEIPSCRWSARQCLARGVDCENPATLTEGLESCCSPDHRRIIRERAWTSPVWYTPAPAVEESGTIAAASTE